MEATPVELFNGEESPAELSHVGKMIDSLSKIAHEGSLIYRETSNSTAKDGFRAIDDLVHSVYIVLRQCEIKDKELVPWKVLEPTAFELLCAMAKAVLCKVDGNTMQALMPIPSKRYKMFRESPEDFVRLTKQRQSIPKLWESVRCSIDTSKFFKKEYPAWINATVDSFLKKNNILLDETDPFESKVVSVAIKPRSKKKAASITTKQDVNAKDTEAIDDEPRRSTRKKKQRMT